jgi:hypothetical protein
MTCIGQLAFTRAGFSKVQHRPRCRSCPPGTVRVGHQQNDRQGASHHGAGAASGPRRRDSRLARGESESGLVSRVLPVHTALRTNRVLPILFHGTLAPFRGAGLPISRRWAWQRRRASRTDHSATRKRTCLTRESPRTAVPLDFAASAPKVRAIRSPYAIR